jgi:hypothetical protein
MDTGWLQTSFFALIAMLSVALTGSVSRAQAVWVPNAFMGRWLGVGAKSMLALLAMSWVLVGVITLVAWL